MYAFFSVLISKENKEEYFWIYNGIEGILFAIITRASEMCMLELQPKEHIGKVAGLAGFLGYVFRGLIIGFVGVFWIGPYFSSPWYGAAGVSSLILLLSIIMIMMTRYHS